MIDINSLCLPAEAEGTAVNLHFSYVFISTWPDSVEEWRGWSVVGGCSAESVWLWTEPIWSPTVGTLLTCQTAELWHSDTQDVCRGCLLGSCHSNSCSPATKVEYVQHWCSQAASPRPVCVNVLLLHLFHYTLIRGVPAWDHTSHITLTFPAITYLIAPFSSLQAVGEERPDSEMMDVKDRYRSSLWWAVCI